MEYSTKDFTEAFREIAESYKDEFGVLSLEQINKAEGDSWSIGTIVEHLIKTNDSYEKTFDSLLAGNYKVGFLAKIPFLAKWFGNMILNSVKPGSRKIKTIEPFAPEIKAQGTEVFQLLEQSNDKMAAYVQKLSEKNLMEKIIASPANDKIVYPVHYAFSILLEHERKHLEQAKAVKATLG